MHACDQRSSIKIITIIPAQLSQADNSFVEIQYFEKSLNHHSDFWELSMSIRKSFVMKNFNTNQSLSQTNSHLVNWFIVEMQIHMIMWLNSQIVNNKQTIFWKNIIYCVLLSEESSEWSTKALCNMMDLSVATDSGFLRITSEGSVIEIWKLGRALYNQVKNRQIDY